MTFQDDFEATWRHYSVPDGRVERAKERWLPRWAKGLWPVRTRVACRTDHQMHCIWIVVGSLEILEKNLCLARLANKEYTEVDA